jgi:hypothetical protein
MDKRYAGPVARQFGTYYPLGYVVAVLDPAAVAGAVEALRTGPCVPDDVRTFSSQDVLDIDRAAEARETPLQRLEGALASDEGEAQSEYLDAARRGQSFLVVHAPDADQTERVRTILAAHGARQMRHYGPLVMTDLSSAAPSPAVPPPVPPAPSAGA